MDDGETDSMSFESARKVGDRSAEEGEDEQLSRSMFVVERLVDDADQMVAFWIVRRQALELLQ